MRRLRPQLLLLAATAVSALCAAAPARAADGLVVGLADNALKYDAAQAASAYERLGVGGVRLAVTWRGEASLGGTEQAWLDRAMAAAGPGLQVVLSVYGAPEHTPLDTTARDRYCGFVRSALARYPGVRDVVVWNEVNKNGFWRPQFAADGASLAPAAYAELLARCWDVLHAFRPDVNLIVSTSSRGNDNPQARSNVSHSPGNFIRKLGEAYRLGGRTRPLFDTVGHHPYGESSAERPWRRHPLSTTIGQGDWDKLVQAYHDGFAATAQAHPGRCVAGRCAPIWYMEVGYQTSVSGHASLYHGTETDPHLVAAGGAGDRPGALPTETSAAPDHGTQLAEAIRLAYCQPYVGAYFNFLLRDETDLDRWQSGVLWADWSPKPSFSALAAAVAEAAGRRVDCERVARLVVASGPRDGTAAPSRGNAGAGGAAAGASGLGAAAFPAPRSDVGVLRVAWPASRRFNWRHDQWRFRLAAGEPARYVARLVGAGGSARGLATAGRPLLESRGTLRTGYFSFVTFGRRRLAPGGVYRMEVVLTSAGAPGRSTRLLSPAFRVLPRPPRR